MNDLLSRLRRTIERERAFVDDASHELRFAPAGSVIVIAAREDGPDLSIEVRPLTGTGS